MSLLEYAENELRFTDIEQGLKDDILSLVSVFSKQGHSGMSASIVRNLFVNKVRDSLKNISEDLYSKKGDFYGGMTGNALKELSTTLRNMNLIEKDKNSVLEKFNLLAKWKPLSPLTFKDEEWREIREGSYQNIRNSAVFRNGKDGRPYYIDAYIMIREDDGTGWYGFIQLKGNKRVGKCYIKNPVEMPTIRISIPTVQHSEDPADWDFLPLGESNLRELKKYYDLEIMEEAV